MDPTPGAYYNVYYADTLADWTICASQPPASPPPVART